MGKREEIERDYEVNVGHPPEERFPEGSEGARQWSYRGTPKDKAELQTLLGAGYADEEEVTLEAEQESLF